MLKRISIFIILFLFTHITYAETLDKSRDIIQADDHGDTYKTASIIKANQTISGVLNKKADYDIDIIKMVINKNGYLKISKNGIPLFVRMERSNGSFYAGSKNGEFSFHEPKKIEYGIYYIIIQPYNKNILTGNYSISFSKTDTDKN